MCYLHLCFSLAGRCPRTRKCQFHFFPSVLPQSGSEVHLDCPSTKRTWRILSLWCICDAFVYKWKSAPLIGVAVKMFASRSRQIFRKFVFRISPDQISSFFDGRGKRWKILREFHEKGKVAIYLGWQNVDGICQKQGFVKGPPFTGKWRVGLGGQHSAGMVQTCKQDSTNCSIL